MFWMEYVDAYIFFITLGIAVFIGYMFSPEPTLIFKTPTAKNSGKITYKDESGVCYQYRAKKIS